jgi:O-antigen ligase
MRNISVPVLVHGCLLVIISISGFGQIQQGFLPGPVEAIMYLAACAGLGLAILLARQTCIAGSSLIFLFGLGAVVTLQLLVQAPPGNTLAKAIATALIFILLAAVPALSPAILLRILRSGALLNLLASAAVLGFSGLGYRSDVGGGGVSMVGWFEQKNYLGLTAAIACATLIVRARERALSLTWWCLSALAVLLLWGSHSRGGLLWIAAFTGCYLASLLSVNMLLLARGLLIVCVATIVAIVVAPYEFLLELESWSTGRTVVWEQARTVIENSPWIGHGVGASYRGGALFFDHYGNAYTGVHNGYLALLIDTGALGFLSYMVMIASAVRLGGQTQTSEGDALLCILSAFLVYNLIESGLDKTTNLSFVVFALAHAACMKHGVGQGQKELIREMVARS